MTLYEKYDKMEQAAVRSLLVFANDVSLQIYYRNVLQAVREKKNALTVEEACSIV